MSIAQNAQSAGMTKKTLGNDAGSDLSCSTLPDDGKETTAISDQRLRESSSSSPPPGSLNFAIKLVVPKRTTAAGSSISNASTQLRGRSSTNSNPKSRHAVHFASVVGGANHPGEEDPAQDRSSKAVASPPPPSATAFSRNPAAAVNPNRVVEVAVSAGDGLSRIGRRESEGPRGDHEDDSSAPAAVYAASVGGMAAVAKANVKKGWGPRQRAMAETAVLAHGGSEGAEAGGGGGGRSGVEAAPAATGTFMNQSRLPKLEIPPLAETLQRYLGAVAPLLSPEAFAVTKDVVKEFETSGEGEELQRSLLEYSVDKDSYVEEFWDDSYLTANSSVVLNLNPFFVFETPTLSNHSKDPWGGDEFSDVTAGNRGRCSSCGSGGGGWKSRVRARSPRRRAAGRDGQRSYNDTSPPACYRHHFPRQQQQQEQGRYRSGSPSRWAGDANGLSTVATEAGKRQARRAASLLYSSLRFAAAVKNETLPPDVWRDTPLCMAQYKRLFGAHRKAMQNDADEMRVCEDSRHVVVLCRNQFYCFSALHADGRVGITEEELEEIVLAVQEDAAKARLPDTAARAVGVLTTETRGDWAAARRKLAAADETNKRYLHLVDTALFVLCLDHTAPCTAAEIAASCLHGSYALEGDAQVGTCTNRWYDKLQIIAFENGAAGVNFEHTWVDGHTVLRFASDVFADVIYRFANHLTSTTGGARGREGMGAVFPPDKQPFSLCEGRTPKKMEWRLPKDIRREIYFAETRISDLIRQHDVQALEYDTFGKRFITQNKMSPDAFVQMAIVYGYYGLYGDVVAAYEPVLTKVFLKGRTEALRTVTAEVKAFLEAFCNPETPAKRKILSLRSAIVSHGRLVKLAAKGKGVDRHLFALLCMAKRKVKESTATAAAAAAAAAATESERKAVAEGGGGEGAYPAPPPPYQFPSLFEDEAWRVLNHVILSTSNCGNPSLRLFGFGPVVRDGFGIGYIIKENQLKLVVTSKNRQTDRFVGKVREFFDTVFNTYSRLQVQGRVRVMSAEETSGDSGTYSMWGSFSKVV